MKYRECCDAGRQMLVDAGIGEASLDAALLLEAVCHTDRQTLLAHGDREVAETEYLSYVNLLERRRKHEPLQYILGEQEFMGLSFKVTPQVLIPRQDTEILVEEVMRFLHDGMELLDLCTGSGCILLSLLHYSNGCVGVGSDFSADALAVARENALRLKENRAKFVCSDLFEKIEGSFDIIVSNPPYIKSGEIPALMKEVRDYEPLMALDGKGDGQFFYKRIIREAHKYLKGGGCLFFETGYDQAEAVSEQMKENGFKEVTVVKDYAGHNRVVYGWAGLSKTAAPAEKETGEQECLTDWTIY